MYRTAYNINKNLANAMTYLLGEVVNPIGEVETVVAMTLITRLMEQNKKEILKSIRSEQKDATASLYEEEVCDIINSKSLARVTVVMKNSNKTPKTYCNIDKIVEIMVEITMLANNMINPEEV